jgi:hypothetical protein
MTHGITITCAHCGAATDFDQAVEGLPMDHFRCGSCSKIWKRCHGKPHFCDGGFVLPGSVTIKEVHPRVRQTELVRKLEVGI